MITKAQLATMLQISMRHLENLVRLGRTPRPVRIGRCVRFRVTDVDGWIAAGCETPTR